MEKLGNPVETESSKLERRFPMHKLFRVSLVFQTLNYLSMHQLLAICHVSQFTQATITKYHRLGGLTNRHDILNLLEAGCLRSECQYGQVLVQAFFLACRLCSLTVSLGDKERKPWCLFPFFKRTLIMLSADKWMELENIMLSEISQSPKAKGWMFSLISGRVEEL